jgi:uncharacterized membrane protein
MLNLLLTELNRMHSIVVAFPLALLVVSVLLDLIAYFRLALRADARPSGPVPGYFESRDCNHYGPDHPFAL